MLYPSPDCYCLLFKYGTISMKYNFSNCRSYGNVMLGHKGVIIVLPYPRLNWCSVDQVRTTVTIISWEMGGIPDKLWPQTTNMWIPTLDTHWPVLIRKPQERNSYFTGFCLVVPQGMQTQKISKIYFSCTINSTQRNKAHKEEK